MAEDAPAFDALRLIADLRAGVPEAIDEAYRRTFGHDLGRLVLAHHMAECGVGSVFGAHLTDAELRYQAGRHDAAIMLAQAAHFDQAAMVTAVLSDDLEGKTDDETSNHQTDGLDGPYAVLDDDFVD